jgi:hypothetical protein
MGKRIAVFQSNYLPWKGFFDLIHSVDEFIIDDQVQYTKQSWRNRNRIKTPHGLQWLTVPVHAHFPQAINEVTISDPNWWKKHWRAVESSYRRAPGWRDFADALYRMWQEAQGQYLWQVNWHCLRQLCSLMGIHTPFRRSEEFHVQGERNQRIIALCKAAGADRLLNGPSARQHMDEEQFRAAGIHVDYADYQGYPEYPQLHGPFEHQVSIIDLLLCCGHDFPEYMLSFSGRPAW